MTKVFEDTNEIARAECTELNIPGALIHTCHSVHETCFGRLRCTIHGSDIAQGGGKNLGSGMSRPFHTYGVTILFDLLSIPGIVTPLTAACRVCNIIDGGIQTELNASQTLGVQSNLP